MKKIGFIGTGVMGASMVRNLLKHGYEVSVYNRTFEKAKILEKDGAHFTSSIEECVSDVDVVITIVGLPRDVKEVYSIILNHAKPNTIAIDMTTSDPNLALELASLAETKHIHLLDAPVSGGDVGAQKGTLSIMVGGSKEIFDCCKEIFEAMGTNLVYCGPTGMGQHTKAANQIAIAGAIAGVTEALAYAHAMGLDQTTLLSAISAGAAGSWQMTNNGPKMIAHDHAPGFFIKHFVKDMNIGLDCAKENNIHLPVLSTVQSLYQEMIDQGEENLGSQALYEHYLAKNN